MKFIDFLDFLYTNTEKDNIVWEDKNDGTYLTRIATRTIYINVNYIDILGKKIEYDNMDKLSQKIFKKLYNFINNDERYYDKIVADFKKELLLKRKNNVQNA